MISLILPTPGDPLILDTWIRNFKRYDHLVDECVICVNNLAQSHISTETNAFLDDYYNSLNTDKIRVLINHELNDHGLAITKSLDACSGETILLMEDDNYISNVTALEKDLLDVDNKYDIIGIGRSSCDIKLQNEFFSVYNNIPYIGFWPTRFMCKRDLLYKTNLNFSVSQYEDYIPELNLNVPGQSSADTMTSLSMQLIKLVDQTRIKYTNDISYHLSVFDESYVTDSYEDTDKLHINDISDIHIGSLSSTFRSKLFDPTFNIYDIELEIEKINGSENSIKEYMRRFICLYHFLSFASEDSFYYDIYTENITKIINKWAYIDNFPLMKRILDTIYDTR